MYLKYFEELDTISIAHYNKKADDYFIHFANPTFEKNKPFSNPTEAAMISYQIGLLLAGAKIGRAQTILEIGPGAGWLASMVHRLGNEIFLLETSHTALQLAKELFITDQRNAIHTVGPHFLTYDGHHIPLKDNSIDRVLCFDALHHIPNPNEILAEIYRVLTPNGVAGFVESGETHAHHPAIIDCIKKTGILERSTSLDDICMLANKIGFQKVTVKAFPLCTDWEIDVAIYNAHSDAEKPPVEIKKIHDASQLGDQTIFCLYKNREFQFDCKYPNQPLTALTTQAVELRCRKNERCTLLLTINNIGDTLLNHTPHQLGGFATIGAHLLENGQLINYDFFHHPISSDIAPHTSQEEQIQFLAPDKAGCYELELDVIIEGIKWLQLNGATTVTVKLIVE